MPSYEDPVESARWQAAKEPYTEITRTGRCWYEIRIVTPVCIKVPAGPAGYPSGASVDGCFATVTEPPWWAFTRRGAERKAARKLRRYMRIRSYREPAK